MPNPQPSPNFDLFQISKSQEAVGLPRATMHEMVKNGLPIYHYGRRAFCSKRETEDHIRTKSKEQQKGKK